MRENPLQREADKCTSYTADYIKTLLKPEPYYCPGGGPKALGDMMP